MTTTIITPPIVDTYLDVERLIYYVCNKFKKRYGGDIEEMIGEANIIYMKVYKIWKPTGGMSFTSLLCTCVYRKLTDIHRMSIRKSKIWGTSLDGLPFYGKKTSRTEYENIRSINDMGVMEDKSLSPFDIEEFTNDAKTIIQLILDEPEEIKTKVEQKGNQYRNWRSVVRTYLKEIDWTARRISESFEEIRSSL